MLKRTIAAIMSLAMLIGCMPGIIVTAAENTGNKYFLRSDYAVSSEGVTSGTDKTDGSTGDPQITVNEANTAKIVVKTNNLSSMTNATVTFAQNGGTLGVKLIALASADAADGTVLAEHTINAGGGWDTRTEPIEFTGNASADAQYMKVELTTAGGSDSNSYVNYVQLFEGEIKLPPVMVLKTLASDKVIDITGETRGDSVAVSEYAAGNTAQQWTVKEGEGQGWYYIVNQKTGFGMGMSDGTIQAGETPIQWTTSGSADQYWRIVKVTKDSNTYYKILNKNSKLVLTMGDDTVTQETWTGADNQLWIADTVSGDMDGFASDYDDNYAIKNINVSAANNNISYNVLCSMQDGMFLEVKLGEQTKEGAKGTFNIASDGDYTLTASLYADDTKAVKVCDDVIKTITIINGGYEVVGADWICSTEASPYTDNGAIELQDVTDDSLEEIKTTGDYIIADQNTRYQELDANPWGGCFNEMGWEYIMQLDPNYRPNYTFTVEQDGKKYGEKVNGGSAEKTYEQLNDKQKEVIDLLFKPNYGLSFTAARTPIGSSDFGLDFYSYDETTDDYDLSEFSIARDKEFLIPYIKAAEVAAGKTFPIFSSPWTPPSWMKKNNKLNGVESGTPYIEDTKENFEAYANYFVKYLEEYSKLGIEITAITPQNEPTMNTPYPSCVWNGDQLNVFLRDYLCGAIDKYNADNGKNVEVWLGTFTDSNQGMVWPTYKDEKTSKKVDGYCFQWWGAPLATKLYSQSKAAKEPVTTETVEQGKVNAVKMIQSESKCGNGGNTWSYAEEQFDCFKEFLDAGVSQYHLWNMVLDDAKGDNNALSVGRRWPQNAPITVDLDTHEYHINPQFYQVKHFSANIDGYARRIKVEGDNLGEGSVKNHVQDVRAIGFQNTDGEIVLNVKNSTGSDKTKTIVVNDKAFEVTLPAHSINTFKLAGEYINTPDATEFVEVEETTDIKMTNASTGDLLSAEGYSNGSVINTASNRGQSNQTWKLVKSTTEGYYHLTNFETDLGIAVWSGATQEGAEIKQYENTGSDDQKWAIEFVEYRGEGAEKKAYYKIINYNSKLVLTALGASSDNALTQKQFKNTDDQLWTLEAVGGEWTDPTWNHAETEDGEQQTTIYKPNADTDYRCGVIYGRGLQLQADPTSENYGKIYATSEYYQKGRFDSNEHFRFYESSDNGKTWDFVGDLYDTENNKQKFTGDGYTTEGEEDAKGAKKYRNTMWSMKHQPHLYELPEDLGNLKKGTIICAGLTVSNSTTAKNESDQDGSRYTRIDLYYSTDGCRSWNFLGHVTDGGQSRCGYATAIWEPCLYMANGKLYCFYSDERNINKGQKLVAQASTDGKTWGNAFDVVSFVGENEGYRPGMPVVTKLQDGRYVIVYEEYAMNRDGSGKLRSSYKITNDIESWNPTEHGTIMDWTTGGAPYITQMEDGTIVCSDTNCREVYVNKDNLATNSWEKVETGLMGCQGSNTAEYGSYTRCLFPLLNGELCIIGAAHDYGAPLANNSLYCGTLEIPGTTTKPKTITAVTQGADKYTLSTQLKNVPAGNTLIVGAYRADNTLVTVDTNATTAENTVTTAFNKNSDISYFKVMVWDSLSGMKPITAAERVTVSDSEPTPTPTPPLDDPIKPEKDTAHMLYGADFNNQNSTAYKGKTVENGTFTYEKVADGDYAAVFDGSTNYLSLKDDNGGALLKNKNNIIITMKAKAQQPATTNGWYFYASWSEQAQPNGSQNRRSYAGLLESGKNIKGERYRNSNSEPTVDGTSKLNAWQEVTYVITPTKSELYIDGKFCAEADYPVDLSTILGTGDDQVAYVGKANWGSGEYYKGAIDDIEIYDFAPIIDIDNVTADVTLPTATKEKDGYSITWETSNADVITSDGHITRPQEGSSTATLTATITFNGHTLTRPVEVNVLGENYNEMEIEVKNEKGVDIQQNMYGLFFEDINYAADGGLYAEMIENRSFEQMTTNAAKGTGDFTKNPSYAWDTTGGTAEYKTEGGLNENNPTYLQFTGTSFTNQAYEGMYIESGKSYKVSFYAKSDSYTGAVNVSVGDALGGTVTDVITNTWQKYEKTFTATGNARKVPFTVELASNGTIDIDMISVMPTDAVDGVFRKDLVEKLKALNPGFLRFPGGCVIEGYHLADRYNWKDSIGPVEERKQNWNRWAADVSDDRFMNYNQTYGIGFYEYFKLCEYLECDPVPVLNVGMACEYQSNEVVPIYKDGTTELTDEFKAYIQDALDLIEFANGDENTEWGAKRIAMGHTEPFNLTMVGIGNEQWQTDTNQWYTRYEIFEEEIHKVYPDIKLIGTSGPKANDSGFYNAWNWIRGKQAELAALSTPRQFAHAIDEHYYMNPDWFLANDGRYDGYDRGTKVFAGEYASRGNAMYNALAEAAYMTGLERNADVVYMASYAPLFARLNYVQWAPDMIWFDDTTSYGSPNYYVQQMYSTNNGDYTLQTEAVKGPTESKIYQTVSYDTETNDVIVKIANPFDHAQKAKLTFDGFTLSGTAQEQLLSNGANDVWATNTVENPETFKTLTKNIENVTSGMVYEVPAYSFVVLRVHTN